MKDVAAEAGVSVETVYAQGSKSALLLAVVDRTLTGDDESVPLLDRPQWESVLRAEDGRAALEALGELIAAGLGEAVPVLGAFARAAAADPQIAPHFAEYERRRYADMRRIAEVLADHLRPGVTVEEATDVLWGLVSWEVILLFVRERDWEPGRYGRWVADALARILLAAPSSS